MRQGELHTNRLKPITPLLFFSLRLPLSLWCVLHLLLVWVALFCFSSSIGGSTMVDHQIVCSMCGDVGFPDKLFRCTKCLNRFQHSYCSNYYSESSEPIEVCDWCKSEERSARHGGSSRKSVAGNEVGMSNRSEYSGERIKQHDREEAAERGKNPSGTPSPRPTTRRYKLLKDVMC